MSASAQADEEGRKIFLGGLSYDASEDDLKSDFGKYGELEDVQLPIADGGGKHKGFAFITFKKAEDAQYAVKQHHQVAYMGREISAKIVIPRSDRGGGKGGGRPEDWECPKCGANVFGSKSSCYKCGEPKPRGGGSYGGGGYGGGRGGDRYDDRRDDRGGGRDRRDDRYDDRRGGDRYDDRRREDRRRSYSPDRRRRSYSRDRSYDRRDRGRD